MRTILKEGSRGISPQDPFIGYSLDDLENADKLRDIIQEYEVQLKPCAHCGGNMVHVCYRYIPEYMAPYWKESEKGKSEIASKPHPHALYVECRWTNNDSSPPDEIGCCITTMEWHASDDEADFREALRRIVVAWNRRPGDPEDRSIRW